MGLRLMRYFFFAVLGVFGTGLAWLFWPLPDARFDWQGMVQVHVELGQCDSPASIYLGVANADPEALRSFLNGRSIEEICPISPEMENPAMFEDGYAAYFDNAVAEALSYSPYTDERLQEGDAGVRAALAAIQWNRELRQRAGLGWLGWHEIVIGLRCDYPLNWSRQSAWYQGRSILVYPGQVMRELSAWERRKEWCDGYANRQLRALQEDTGKPLPLPLEVEVSRGELFRQYRTWALEWKRPGDVPPPQ